MAQLDDIVGSVMKYLQGQRARRQHDRRLHHRQRRRELHLARWRPDAVRRRQGNRSRRRLPRACDHPLAGQGAGGQGRERHHVGAGLVPDVRRRGRQPQHRRRTEEGKKLGDTTYKVHLDGYNQMDLITGKGPSERHEIFYFTESTLSAVRIDDYKYRFTDQPNGWLGATEKVDWPILVNLRLDPFERTGMSNGKDNGLARLLQLVRLRVLALRVRAAGSGETGQDGDRVPADAKGRELQPRSRESANRESHCGAARQMTRVRRAV